MVWGSVGVQNLDLIAKVLKRNGAIPPSETGSTHQK